MKKLFILTIGLLVGLTLFPNAAAAQEEDEIYVNEKAPADYDANLRAGDRAVGVSGSSSMEMIKIISKSGKVYKASLEDGTDNIYFYRANSVYPFFDLDKFREIQYQNEDLIVPYVECYADKHGIDFEKFKGDAFRPPYFLNADDMKTRLNDDQAKLARLEATLNTLAARPETYLPYRDNPAVWYEIASQRAEYLPCAIGDRKTKEHKESPWLMAHRDGIAAVLKYVENHDPSAGDALMTDSEYAFYAVSPKMRAAWLKEKNALDFESEIGVLLKPLAAALAKKVPNYFPQMGKYAIRNAGEEALMKTALGNTARYKIFKIGLSQSGWDIDTNALGIPNARYKNGMIYARDTTADYPYCVAVRVNVVQAYAGGGTYAASRPDFVNEELVGCPAGGK